MKQDILFAVIVGAVVVGGIVYIGPAAALEEARGFLGIARPKAEYVFGPDYVAPEPGEPPVNPLSYPVTPEPEPETPPVSPASIPVAPEPLPDSAKTVTPAPPVVEASEPSPMSDLERCADLWTQGHPGVARLANGVWDVKGDGYAETAAAFQVDADTTAWVSVSNTTSDGALRCCWAYEYTGSVEDRYWDFE